MKYPFIVNKNGVWYPAGTEVPEGTDAIKNRDNSNKESYTKTEIYRMSTSELKELGMKSGIENAEEMTGVNLKKVLLEKFGL